MSKTRLTEEHKRLTGLMRELREEVGVTQAELASRLGAHQSFIAKCEGNERRVDLVEFIAWCRALGADPGVALGRYLDLVTPNESTPPS